jgi:hypothetical protein
VHSAGASVPAASRYAATNCAHVAALGVVAWRATVAKVQVVRCPGYLQSPRKPYIISRRAGSRVVFSPAREYSMTLDEKIYQYVQKLPRPFQEELLDFIQYLLLKAEQQQEKQDWMLLSLSSATRDMEDEPALYSMEDIKIP